MLVYNIIKILGVLIAFASTRTSFACCVERYSCIIASYKLGPAKLRPSWNLFSSGFCIHCHFGHIRHLPRACGHRLSVVSACRVLNYFIFEFERSFKMEPSSVMESGEVFYFCLILLIMQLVLKVDIGSWTDICPCCSQRQFPRNQPKMIKPQPSKIFLRTPQQLSKVGALLEGMQLFPPSLL